MPTFIRLLKAALTTAIAISCYAAHAQVLVIDATDRPIMPKEYTDLKGSPYLFDNWVKGAVQLGNGVVYKDIFLMYDQVDDAISFTYKSNSTQAQRFVDPVVRFTIGDKVFRRDLLAKGQPMPEEFFEVLVDGETKLLRRTSKKVLNEVNHAVATKQKSIYTVVSYYLTVSGKLVKLKNDKNSVLKALQKHQASIKSYIKDNNLDLKDEHDLEKLITYYNSLT